MVGLKDCFYGCVFLSCTLLVTRRVSEEKAVLLLRLANASGYHFRTKLISAALKVASLDRMFEPHLYRGTLQANVLSHRKSRHRRGPQMKMATARILDAVAKLYLNCDAVRLLDCIAEVMPVLWIGA